MRGVRTSVIMAVVGAAGLLLAGWFTGGGSATAQSAALCVNPGGTNGCSSTIQAAVSAASPGATINVAAGTYNEMVTISQPIRLIGAGASSTTIDATGEDNGVHITADNVWLEGFTISGSRLDGVLVNGNGDAIVENTITGNATLLIPPPAGAPPVPATWNGVNLQNSSNDLVAYNDVSNNAGRGIRTEGSAAYHYPDQGINQVILGQSNHNLIVGNTVNGNKGACGIVLSTDSSDNVVEDNTVTDNPAGIIVAAIPPFGLPNTPFADHIPHSDRNVVANNDVENNIGLGINVDGLTGTVNDTVVSGNTVKSNGAGEESNGQTVGIQVNGAPGAQVDGTVVMGNTASGQQIDMWVVTGSSATNTIGIGSSSSTGSSPSPTGAAPASASSSTPAPSPTASAPSASATNAVTIANFAYHPDPITVPVGTTVTWTNTDDAPHSATADDGSFDTGLLDKGQSASVTFSKAGTFTYYCSIHPFMHGTVTVQ